MAFEIGSGQMRVLGGRAALLAALVPWLVFPNVLPESGRALLVGFGALLALGYGAWLIWLQDRSAGLAVAGVAALAVLSWWTHDRSLADTQQHFGGLAAGILLCGVLAASAVDERQILAAGAVFAAGALAILGVGLASVSVNTGKFVGVLREVPVALTDSLPNYQLPLPGVQDGVVNPNALGGVVLMVLPTVWAVFRSLQRGGWWTGGRAVALSATLLGVLILLVTRSRTALAAVFVVGVCVLVWKMRRSLPAVVVVVGGMGALAVYGATYGGEFGLVADSARTRSVIWSAALDRLQESPWAGIGINHFKDVPSPEGSGVPPAVPHAHNTFIQVALDLGVPGLLAYVMFMGRLLVLSARRGVVPLSVECLAVGAGVSLAAVHLFGMADAISLGAKVGMFVWLNAGLILAVHGRRTGIMARGARA